MISQIKIVISGNVGVGKSTLAQKLAKNFPESKFVPENFQEIKNLEPFFQEEANPYKEGNYNKFCIDMQTEFLELRYKNEQELIKIDNPIIIADRSIFEDYHVFAQSYLKTGKITQDELEVYYQKFIKYTQNVKQPEVFVFLKSNVKNLQNRIQIRGREFERKTKDKYLLMLNEFYDKFFDYVKKNYVSQVIEIDTNNLEIDQVYERVLQQLEEMIQLIYKNKFIRN